MVKKRRIAIPTDDGETICQLFGRSRGFIIIAMSSKGIIKKEMRWNLLSKILTSEHGSHYNLCDCDTVIVNEIGNCHCKRLEIKNIEVIKTAQNSVTQAISDYLESH